MTDPPRIVESLDAIPAEDWDRLHGGKPTVAHAFLDSLHRSGCASPATGWAPCYLTRWDGGRLAGARASALERFETVVVSPVIIREAIDCSIINRISFWGALNVVSAERAHCEILWTEDLNHGQGIREFASKIRCEDTFNEFNHLNSLNHLSCFAGTISSI